MYVLSPNVYALKVERTSQITCYFFVKLFDEIMLCDRIKIQPRF